MTTIHVTFSRAIADVENNKVVVQSEDIEGVLKTLAAKFGGRFNDRYFDKDRRPKRFLNIYVNGIEIRTLNGLQTRLKDNDEIVIIPAITGGSVKQK